MVDLLLPAAQKRWTAWLALAGIVVAFLLTLVQGRVAEELAFFTLYRADGFGAMLNLIILGAAALIILMSVDYLQRTGIAAGEYYVLLLFSVSGMLFLTAANDITVLFVGIVLLSIPLPILAAFRWPQDAKSQESGVKYLILSAFSTAFLVFGLVFLYGGTGETSLAAIYARVSELMAADEAAALFYVALGTGLALVGLGFKVTVVPFHMYAPDVYEGAPTPVTAFLSVVVKAGAFAALLQILREAVPNLALGEGSAAASWQLALWLLAAATLILGNTVAIAQRNIKRMLAYSSIAHAGFILMAVSALGGTGIVLRGGANVLLTDAAGQAILVYLAAYAFSTLGAFAIVMAVERVGWWRPGAGGLRRAGAQPAAARGADGRFHAEPDRHPAHQRFPGEVAGLPGNDRGGFVAAGDHWRVDQRGQRLFLRARHRADVPAGGARGRRRGKRRPAPPPCWIAPLISAWPGR